MDACHKKGCVHQTSYDPLVVSVVGVVHLCSKHVRAFGRCDAVIATNDAALGATLLLGAATQAGDVAAVHDALPKLLATRAALRAAVFAWLDTPDTE